MIRRQLRGAVLVSRAAILAPRSHSTGFPVETGQGWRFLHLWHAPRESPTNPARTPRNTSYVQAPRKSGGGARDGGAGRWAQDGGAERVACGGTVGTCSATRAIRTCGLTSAQSLRYAPAIRTCHA